ncbi:MAG: hypothetical protein C0480_03190 [Bradyrhizobium sp.]|nr:hypothetical protein [Bradyrhizobium sp.]
MAVFELYSKRRARELGNVPDVYEYDKIPEALKVQIIHIWSDAIGIPYVTTHRDSSISNIRSTYHAIAQVLRREYGLFKLVPNSDPDEKAHSQDELKNWFLRETNADRILDAVELSARFIERACSRTDYIPTRQNKEICKQAIEELNKRFQENGVGYQYMDGIIVRVDSQLIHAEAVKPALAVLRAPEFKNAQEEFLSAYEHYRHGKKEEALVDCGKCFESTMKIICTKRNWPFDPNRATAKPLVQICLDNGLIPSYWQSHFSALRTILESAIPTPRNKQGGHGAGAGPAPDIPNELVAYVLHMTASTVLFLTEAEKSLPP